MAKSASLRVLCQVVLSAALLVFLPGPAACAETLIIGGSGTNLPGIRVLARAFSRLHPGVEVQIPASLGTSGGVRAAADGAVSIGLLSRPLRQSEEKYGLTTLPYALTALIIGVNPDVPDRNITAQELVDIYLGKKTKWKNGQEIIVLLREPGDSSMETLCSQVPGFRQAFEESHSTKRWMTLYTDQDMNKMIVKTSSSIGFTDSGAIASDRLLIKPLKFDGVAPSLKNMQDGKYPFAKVLSFAYRAGRLTAAGKTFIDFARSKKGMEILKTSGYLPAL